MTAEEHVGILRSMIEEENRLRNNRMNWLWAGQGLLLAAASILWQYPDFSVVIVALLGLLACVPVSYSVQRGRRSIKGLVMDYEKLVAGGSYSGPPPIGSYGIGEGKWFLEASNVLPLLIGLTWLALGVYRFASK